MTIISPSILASDFLNIETELMAFNDISDIWFHLDIMDGHFVPNLTFGHPVVELITKKTSHNCDAHFMVSNPEFHAESMKNFGLFNFTFHLEAVLNPHKFITELKKNYPSVGISIKPGTATHELSDDVLKAVDLVLLMSVEPGFGGQSFMPNVFDKIHQLKTRSKAIGAHFQIQVDGGINNINASELIKAGADNLVAGSYIFKNERADYKKAVQTLRP